MQDADKIVAEVIDSVSRRVQQKLRQYMSEPPKIGDPEAFGRAVCESLGVGFAGVEEHPDGSMTVEMKRTGFTEADVFRALEEIAAENEAAAAQKAEAWPTPKGNPLPTVDAFPDRPREPAEDDRFEVFAVLFENDWSFCRRVDVDGIGGVWVDLYNGDDPVCFVGAEAFHHRLGMWAPGPVFTSSRGTGR